MFFVFFRIKKIIRNQSLCFLCFSYFLDQTIVFKNCKQKAFGSCLKKIFFILKNKENKEIKKNVWFRAFLL